MSDSETLTMTIEGPDGTDEVDLPARLIEMLAEEDETTAEVVGDLALMSCAQRIHTVVHHGEGGEGLEDVEAHTMELFEDRFGMTYGEATGHSH
jgi:hypothetical protein